MHFLKNLMLLTFFIVTGNAYSAVVTFDGGFEFVGAGGSIQRQGFVFTAVNSGFIEVGLTRDLGGLFNANDARFDMTAVGGDIFNLSSFDLSRRQNDSSYIRSASSINIIGSLNGGGSVSFNTGALTDGFSNILLPTSFVNLNSVAFNPVVNANNGNLNFEFIVDNISTNTGTVPEPSALALLGIGLAGIGFGRLKNQTG